MSGSSVSIADFIDPDELRKQSARIEKAFTEGRVLRDAMDVDREVLEKKHKFAHDQFAEGDFQTGINIFRYLVALDPYDTRLWLGLGGTWLGRRNPGKALECCFVAMLVEPEHPVPPLMASLVYLQAGSQAGADAMIKLIPEPGREWQDLVDAGRTLVAGGSADPELHRREADSLLQRCMRHLAKCRPDTSLDAVEAQQDKAKAIHAAAEAEAPGGAPAEFKQFKAQFLEGFQGNVIQFALQFLHSR